MNKFTSKSKTNLDRITEDSSLSILQHFSSQQVLFTTPIVSKSLSNKGKDTVTKINDIQLDNDFLKWNVALSFKDKEILKKFVSEFHGKFSISMDIQNFDLKMK